MPLGDLRLIEAKFIEAATDPSQWIKALDVVTSVTDSFGAVLIPVTGGMMSALPHTESLSGSFEAFIKDGWHTRDERNRGVAIMKQRGIVDDLDIFSPEAITRHPYYQEFLAPHRLRWFGGIAIDCGSDLWCLSIQRTIEQGPFSEAEKGRMACLSKRLSGVAAIASMIGGSVASTALEAFDVSGRGAALVNRSRRIFRLNRVAEEILKGDVRIIKGRLVAEDAAAAACFDRAISNLVNDDRPAMRSPVAFARGGRSPLLAYPTKLPSMTLNALADCQVMVIFVDTELLPRPATTALQTVFSLSPAEARLATQLAAGEALEKVADKLGIAKATSRTQLKSVFAKTGCHRQSELVAMLSTFLQVDVARTLSKPGQDTHAPGQKTC